MSNICVPAGARAIISILEQSGFEAYVVGGCVRDSLLGLEPKDWDICTSATTDDILRICTIHGARVIETGKRYGTLTIHWQENWYEVTTFRIDGKYSDGRHPDNVSFTSSLYEDLARRDFTMNAMAYNDSTGIIDPFHGVEALNAHTITCVGNPMDRFKEDALRIMRALRFASTYGFVIDPSTIAAIHDLAPNLVYVSSERVRDELSKLLGGKGVLDILLKYNDVIATIIPEFIPCIGFNQNNRYHQYTVYDHIAHAVANYTGSDTTIKIALLLHDIGKPQCYTEDERGGHFHGHEVPSRDIANVVMRQLRFDNKTRRDVLELVLNHDAVIEPTQKTVRRWLNKLGEEQFCRLLKIRKADILAHAEGTQESRLERWAALELILEEVLTQEHCFSMKDLNIKGRDILSLGVEQGKGVGVILDTLFSEVLDGVLANEHDVLMLRATSFINDSKPVA